IDMVDDDERRWRHFNPEIPKRSGKIGELEKFDATFFGVHFKQAHTMDPQTRILIETAYEAVIDAGVNPKSLRGSKTGVYIGSFCTEKLLDQFYKDIDQKPSDLGYLEAHSTGTVVGDPEECKAIDNVLCSQRQEPLLVGSVKSNVGHSEAASGICSLTLLSKGLNLIHILTSNDPEIYQNILHSFVGIAAVQIGLTDVLRSLNLEPDFIIGHSVGELGCAYADGGLTPQQMILAAYYRGRMQRTAFFDVYVDHMYDRIIAGGIELVGLHASPVQRRRPPGIPVLEEYVFLPFSPSRILSLKNAARVCVQIALENNPSLKMKDVMLATGRLAVELYGSSRIDQSCVLGFEYSGTNVLTGRRIMSMVVKGGVASYVEKPSKLIWDIPDHWSLEEAATVPVQVKLILKQSEPFYVIGYSYGTFVALELAKLLENSGFRGNIMLLDGAPHFLKKLTNLHLGENFSDNNLYDLIFTSIVNQIFPEETKESTSEVFYTLDTLSEKMSLFMDYVEKQNIYSKEYSATMVHAMFKRVKMASSFDLDSIRKIKSPITLVRPTEVSLHDIDEDYCISLLTSGKVTLKVIEGNHTTMLDNPLLSQIINDFDPALLEDKHFEEYIRNDKPVSVV
ncbi:hypothetical protein M5D96_013972, partial [Drosophila gunungcola]